mmetsp:Transcript_24788/g.53696  ORF Transcript_24788/g.53696 Transcript_24788/m.53696 type:complete len:96 (-) Transcript_24788:332-619(-)
MSIFKKLGPRSLARGLWGNGPIPTRYKLLFLGQSVIFTMAIWIRGQDVDRAQQMKKLAAAETERQKMREGSTSSTAEDGSTKEGEKEESLPGNKI